MVPHTITGTPYHQWYHIPVAGAVCRYKVKAGLRRSPRGPHTKTRLSSLLTLNLDSSLKTIWFHSTAVQFPHAWHHSKQRHRWVGVNGCTRNGRRDPKCPLARRLRMVLEDTGAAGKGATCACMAADEAVVVRVHFLRCGGLLDDWSVESVLSLVFL
ncbi:uncharacterized protein TNCV_2542831 [Trichonephila clavipes]|nr:uncharacterized protein TNCV_2542831 [Trichonephila clavipes]